MNKRGQATIFIIVGLVILAIFLLIFLLRGRIPFVPVTQESLESEFPEIEAHIQQCLHEFGEKYLWIIAKQGGYINQQQATFRNFFDGKEANSVAYLCFSIPNQNTCQNRMLTREHMESELSQYILNDAIPCIQEIPISSKFNPKTGTPKLDVKIGEDSVIFVLNYPVTLTHQQLTSSRDSFITDLAVPLGRLYDTAQAIVNSEALVGNFETLVYSVKKTEYTGKPYIVQRLQPYPDKLYLIKINDFPTEKNEYTFQFFVQGEDRFES